MLWRPALRIEQCRVSNREGVASRVSVPCEKRIPNGEALLDHLLPVRFHRGLAEPDGLVHGVLRLNFAGMNIRP